MLPLTSDVDARRPRTRPGRSFLACLVVLALVCAGAVWTLRHRSEPLTVVGTTLHDGGDRVVLAGTTAYLLPFYEGPDGGPDQALGATTARSYRERAVQLDRMKAAGVNTLRVPVSVSGYDRDLYGVGGRRGYLARLREVVAAAQDRDMRVIVGWWDSLSAGPSWKDDYRAAFPMMRDVRAALRDQDSVMYEPFNEPHGVSWDEWAPAMSDVVRFWRQDLGYHGVLFVDTIDWSWTFDPGRARTLLQQDAQLLGSAPQLVFANHRYANAQTCFCGDEQAAWVEQVGRYVGQFPIAGTEYGRWDGPSFVPQPRWNADLVRYLADVSVPAGLNGYIAFVWDWVDENSMTAADGTALTGYGRLVSDGIFRRYGDR